jgi:hypothetical protein
VGKIGMHCLRGTFKAAEPTGKLTIRFEI